VAYKEVDRKKIDGRRIVVDVERGRTVRNWRPMRLGGGLGGRKAKKSRKTIEYENAKAALASSQATNSAPGTYGSHRDESKSAAPSHRDDSRYAPSSGSAAARPRSRSRERRPAGNDSYRDRDRDRERPRENSRDRANRDRDRDRNRGGGGGGDAYRPRGRSPPRDERDRPRGGENTYYGRR
jgi:U1 small nuclear ribonucleoprotein 70kDa